MTLLSLHHAEHCCLPRCISIQMHTPSVIQRHSERGSMAAGHQCVVHTSCRSRTVLSLLNCCDAWGPTMTKTRTFRFLKGPATKRQRLPPSQTSQPAFIAPTECLTSQWGVDFSQHLSQSQLADEIAGCLDDAASFDGFASIFPPVDTPLRPAGTVSPLSSGLARDVHRHYAQEQAPQRRVPPRVHRIRCH